LRHGLLLRTGHLFASNDWISEISDARDAALHDVTGLDVDRAGRASGDDVAGEERHHLIPGTKPRMPTSTNTAPTAAAAFWMGVAVIDPAVVLLAISLFLQLVGISGKLT